MYRKRPIQSRTWKTELKPESEYFDFATTAQVAFDVNYGKIAGGALIEVFTEDPITYQTNNLYSINGEAVFKIFADADGRFTGNVELPKATEKVYIISQSWGAPMYVEADVENGKVVVDMTENNANTRSTAMTRAKSNLTIDLRIGRNGYTPSLDGDNLTVRLLIIMTL